MDLIICYVSVTENNRASRRGGGGGGMHGFLMGVPASFLNLRVTFQYSLGLDVSMSIRLFNH